MEKIQENSQPIIEMVNLSKVYGEGDAQVIALDKINLQVFENEYVAIMGASGSGKSTLLNLIGCLDRPSSGKYFLGGSDEWLPNGFDVRSNVSGSFETVHFRHVHVH